MPMAQLIITAVTVEGRSKSEVARDYGVSRFWVQQLIKRFDAEGVAAFEPRSRRPHASPQAVDADTEEMIIRLRKELSKQGLDAGAETIAAHLARQIPAGGGRPATPAVSTIWRILSRRGFVRPQPQKRPRSSWRTFCADQPNERWQADITHWQLADGTEISILNIIDDHSRLCLGSDARRNTTGPEVVASFRKSLCSVGNPGRSAQRQWGGLHRQTTRRWTGRPRDRTRCPRGEIRPLPALPPANLRQGGAVPPNPEEVACRPASREHRSGVATPAGPVRRLLQHHPAPPGAGTTHPGPGLRRETKSGSHRRQDPRPLPGPQRHHRLRRHRHPAPQQPATPHRNRRRPPRNPSHPARRRPTRAHHRPRHRRADPRADPQSHPRLPAPRPAPRPAQKDHPKCNDVPRHPPTVSRDITRAARDSNPQPAD